MSIGLPMGSFPKNKGGCKTLQIHDIEAYERGFRKGFTGPPGLVDGSADFNLGHSDGMMAKMKKSPNQKDAVDGK